MVEAAGRQVGRQAGRQALVLSVVRGYMSVQATHGDGRERVLAGGGEERLGRIYSLLLSFC